MPTQKRPTQKRKENKVNEDQDVLGYVHKQAPRHAAICKTLLKEIAAVLPKANPTGVLTQRVERPAIDEEMIASGSGNSDFWIWLPGVVKNVRSGYSLIPGYRGGAVAT